MKTILYGIIVIIIFFSIIRIFYEIGNKINKNEKYNFMSIIISITAVCSSLVFGILINVLSDFISSEFLSVNKSTTSISKTENSDFFDETEETLFTENISTEESEETLFTENTYVPDTEETNEILNNIEDITAETSISGKITYEGQEDKYLYKAAVSGTYHFSTDLSAGGSVKISVYGENGNVIKINYYDELTIDLEAEKTYILCIGYRNGPCDYTTNIGVPNEIKNITGKTSVSGSITYKNQEDKYLYKAAVSGTYHFSTDLSAGGSVEISVYGENGNVIKINYYDELTIDLEAEKTYILCIGYRNGPCDYTANIGVPNEIKNITGKTSVSGSITYKNQKDKYLYKAAVSGKYHFSTDLSAGGSVEISVYGENGNVIKTNYYDELTIDLEAEKTYILCVEYRNNFCSYDLLIEY